MDMTKTEVERLAEWLYDKTRSADSPTWDGLSPLFKDMMCDAAAEGIAYMRGIDGETDT